MIEFRLARDHHAFPGLWKPYTKHRGDPKVTHLHPHVGATCPHCGTFFCVCPTTNPIGPDGVTTKPVRCPRCYLSDIAKFLEWTATVMGPARN